MLKVSLKLPIKTAGKPKQALFRTKLNLLRSARMALPIIMEDGAARRGMHPRGPSWVPDDKLNPVKQNTSV